MSEEENSGEDGEQKGESPQDDGRPPVTPKEGPANPYRHFQKFKASEYAEVNAALKAHSLLTAREWVIARLCSDMADASGRAPMSYIGEHLEELVPFMEGTYSRQDVAAARAAFQRKVERCTATIIFAYYSGLLSMEEMVEVVHSSVEHLRSLLAMEGSEMPDDISPDAQALLAEFLRNVSEELEK